MQVEESVVGVLCGGIPSDRNRKLGIAVLHEIVHPSAKSLGAIAILHQGPEYRCRATAVAGIPTLLRFDLHGIDEWLVTIRK